MISLFLIHYISQYGYVGLYFILAVSILGIPVPDEFLLTFVGYLTYSGKLNPIFAILSAIMGSSTGITAAYLLGKFFREKVLLYLKRHAGSQRLERVFNWYHRHSGILLAIGYFIPGVRHLSGYIAGLSQLNYRYFAFFAYLGATIWSTLFILLGRLLGSRWNTILPIIHRYSLLLGVLAVLLSILFYYISGNHGQKE
ncbi:MAG: DedA family protein [Desulfitobacteriaceae bacterium]